MSISDVKEKMDHVSQIKEETNACQEDFYLIFTILIQID
jgi:hypothetical protein